MSASMYFYLPSFDRALCAGADRAATSLVRRNWELISLIGGHNVVTALCQPDHGPAQTIEARWVVAFDCASSAVRELLGIDLDSLVHLRGPSRAMPRSPGWPTCSRAPGCTSPSRRSGSLPGSSRWPSPTTCATRAAADTFAAVEDAGHLVVLDQRDTVARLVHDFVMQ